ncbi:hypothetical protein B0H21DRAFT_883849 [Amylocystis lapponica]|nr:hypothetical protein B0H21DRAFT_883849 [Amylocystis lapponica]
MRVDVDEEVPRLKIHLPARSQLEPVDTATALEQDAVPSAASGDSEAYVLPARVMDQSPDSASRSSGQSNKKRRLTDVGEGPRSTRSVGHQDDLMESEDESPEPAAPPAKRKRGQPKKPVEPEVEDGAGTFSVSVFVSIEKPPKPVLTAKGKPVRNGRMEKEDPWMMGSGLMTEEMSWDGFLRMLVDLVGVQRREELVLSSMSWRWARGGVGKNGSLPLSNEAGFKTLVAEVGSMSKNTSSVIVNMAKPKMNQEAPPWAVSEQQPSAANLNTSTVDTEKRHSPKDLGQSNLARRYRHLYDPCRAEIFQGT